MKGLKIASLVISILLLVLTLMRRSNIDSKMNSTSPVGQTLMEFDDYREGMEYAQENRMPVLLYFTGYAVVNCRKMEENMRNDPLASSVLNNYVLISLFVDDREALSEEEQFDIYLPSNYEEGKYRQKTIKTIGDRYSSFEALQFAMVSQPYYVILSPEGHILTEGIGYTPDMGDWTQYLRNGLMKFNEYKTNHKAFERITVDPFMFNQFRLKPTELINPTPSSSGNVPTIFMEHVNWQMTFEHIADNQGILKIEATIDDGWKIPSQFLDSFDGPLPTWIQFQEPEGYELIGGVKEDGTVTEYDEIWEMEITYFKNKITLTQNISYDPSLPVAATCLVDYMIMDDDRCFPPNTVQLTAAVGN